MSKVTTLFGYSEYHHTDVRKMINIFSIECSSLIGELLTECSIVKVKLVVLDSFEAEKSNYDYRFWPVTIRTQNNRRFF